MREVAQAAHALHEHGVIHRDIKPGNIMVTADGAQAVLMDLGLAQLADDVEGRLTRTRQFVGTLRYASPEQVLAVAKLDRRSDVYSLGATLWELLTLRPLFGATEQTPTPELMQRIQIEEPERPRKYHPGLPRDLEAIILRVPGKRREPALRDSPASWRRTCGRFLAGEPVRARPVRGWEWAWKWVKRRPAVAGLLALSVLAVLALVVGGVSLFYNDRLKTANDRLKTALESEQNLRKFADEQHEKAEKAVLESAAAQEYYAAFNKARLQVAALEPGWIRAGLKDLDLAISIKTMARDFVALRGEVATCLAGVDVSEPVVLAPGIKASVLAFTPDGKYLAVGNRDATLLFGNVHLIELASPKKKHVFGYNTSHFLEGTRFVPDGARSMAFSPDGKRLFLGTRRGQIHCWELDPARRTDTSLVGGPQKGG